MKYLFLLTSIICCSIFILNSSGCGVKQQEDKLNNQVVEKKQNVESHIIDSLLQRYNILIEKMPTNWELNEMNSNRNKNRKSSYPLAIYKIWAKDFGIVQDQLIDYRQKGKMSVEQVNKHKQLSNKHNEYLTH